MLRTGKFVEHFKLAAIAADAKTSVDPVLKFCAVGRQVGYGVYLALDTLTVVCLLRGSLFWSDARSRAGHSFCYHHLLLIQLLLVIARL